MEPGRSSTFAGPKSRFVWTVESVSRARRANTLGSRGSRRVSERAPMPRWIKSKDTEGSALGRRGFLKAATLAGTGAYAGSGAIAQAAASPETTAPAGTKPQGAAAAAKSPPRHSVQLTSRESEQGAPPHLEGPSHTTCGSDFMVDVMRNLGIDYVAAIPGNTFKGLHESIINYGMTTTPALEHISCMHEEISVAIAHGYAKIAGKPMP